MADNSTVLEVNTGEIETKSDRKYGGDFNWQRYKTLVGRRFAPHTPLEDLRDLSKTKSLDMKVNIEGQQYGVQLPNEMMARLVRYLSDAEYPFDKGQLDCVGFVHRMLGVPYNFEDGIDLEKFDMVRLRTDWDIKPGDVIHMFTGANFVKGSDVEHAMVYIGHGLYLSKAGEKNGLGVQKLYQLQEMYGKCNLFKQVFREGVQI